MTVGDKYYVLFHSSLLISYGIFVLDVPGSFFPRTSVLDLGWLCVTDFMQQLGKQLYVLCVKGTENGKNGKTSVTKT